MAKTQRRHFSIFFIPPIPSPSSAYISNSDSFLLNLRKTSSMVGPGLRRTYLTLSFWVVRQKK